MSGQVLGRAGWTTGSGLTTDRPDLAGMIRDLNTAWPMQAVEACAPTRCSGPQLRDTALLIHAAAGSGTSCAALMDAGVW